MDKRPLRPVGLIRNPVSLFGIGIACLNTAVGLPLMVTDFFSRHTNAYLGVVIYLVCPMGATAGVILILLGLLWERRRRKRRPELGQTRLPSLDLNRPSHRAFLLGAFLVAMTGVMLLSLTGYRAYHFTESVEFCGLVCHQVMKPEFTAYQHSPHARVACASCHVGPGASWFVRSKITGAYQVYAVSLKKYPRPIPTPIEDLRPAQETCEQCHWPEKFFGAKQKVFQHYLADETNSPWQIQMLIKVGGGDPERGTPAGIHWHMNINKEIYYAARDEGREEIPWIKVVDRGGHATEYVSTENPLTAGELASREVRRMDCMDCHNRPSHHFHPPDRAVERAFETERLDPTLPYLKREAIRILAEPYLSEDEAVSKIQKGLAAYYERSFPDLAREKALEIRRSAEELGKIYARNFFPEMKADWRAYPDHIGHLNSEGCFRCHDGLHRSGEGHTITKDCNACHTILAQGPPQEVAAASLVSQPFRHPVDLGMDVTEFKCSQCHQGTSGL
ncbi:MAG: NapC/NirT family cytochrome c [Candidatus Omnitrophica bacterium]|nr:NapC/NirT family cytochrome c [Candidatus Omnitrophota bacterium]